MYVTSISLSYVFLAIGIAALIFFLYFKLLVAKSSPASAGREKILGQMKDPDTWRYRNNRIAYISLFWAIVSIALFIYLKYYYGAGLVSVIYPFIYAALVAFSIAFFSRGQKSTAQ